MFVKTDPTRYYKYSRKKYATSRYISDDRLLAGAGSDETPLLTEDGYKLLTEDGKEIYI